MNYNKEVQDLFQQPQFFDLNQHYLDYRPQQNISFEKYINKLPMSDSLNMNRYLKLIEASLLQYKEAKYGNSNNQQVVKVQQQQV